MNKTLVVGFVVALAGIGGYVAMMDKAESQTAGLQTVANPQPGAAIVTGIYPPEGLTPQEALGKQAFDGVCAACHGDNGSGLEGKGPPFLHAFYKPGHHGDAAFEVAVQNGVRAHHWPFGNMPPQPGLTRADVANIIAYVRRLQRENGIQ